MMKFTRPKRPGYLDNYKVWGREYAKKKKEYIEKKRKTPAKWNKKIKQWDQLKCDLAKLTVDHCSFCDSYPLVAKHKQTVEHFRPRSIYPKLTFVWHNLFLSCEICQKKGDRFSEKLLKPDAVGYDFYRYFIINFKTGEIEINTRASKEDQERAKITRIMYGLNNYDRPKARSDYYSQIRHQKKKINHIDDLSYRFMFDVK
ncbi:hypothetical protein [Candidatus Parabeggiatoa sp. HSG14]|uniref:hypothetical protein n=1 Tax=Candidatus Parabeggiatoa sp. HSG14 TaxID=3055593 RepID=UPI0025A8E05C|nr:hypothetical protein [Thiotrichales bacterium HSG14]